MICKWPIWDRKKIDWVTYICIWYKSVNMREQDKVWGKLKKQVY